LNPLFGYSLSLALLAGLTGCGGGSSATTPPIITITISLAASNIVVGQDGAPALLGITFSGPSGTPSVNVTGLPSGVNASFTLGVGGASGTIQFVGSPSVPAGTYAVNAQVSIGTQSKSASLSLISAPVIAVGPSLDTSLGNNRFLSQVIATSFQPAEWDNTFFATNPTQKTQALSTLTPHFIRIQSVSQGVPMRTNTNTSADWDFTTLDDIVQPVLPVASLEFQVAVAPTWMNDASGHLDVTNHLNDFATYAANLVRYYNKGGFDWGGKHFQSPLSAQYPIHWWGVFNEYNINGLNAAQYTKLYNTVVPAMLAVDPSIQLSAQEFSDFGLGTGDSGDPMQFLPTFFASPAKGGANAPVDVVSTHFYSTCNQKDSDTQLFDTVPQFAQNVQYFYSQIATRPDLANTQVWVTENNVNADYNNNGVSACNPGQPFVTDTRGTSAFFAAWRPYVFSQLAKVGNKALFHWDYDADPQYGEVDYNSGNPYLSYWVDQYLSHAYQPAFTLGILQADVTESSDIEVLATVTTNTNVNVMIINHAVHSPSDNNGKGESRTVIVDYSKASLPYRANLTNADIVTFDASTNPATGPTATQVPFSNRIPVTINGYGTAVLGVGP